METTQTGDNTQRVISNEKLVADVEPKKPMTLKKKLIIGFAIFLTIGAIVGLAVGLYYRFRPVTTHIQTIEFTTNDGNANLATKYRYTKNNLNGENIDGVFTLVFSEFNSSSQSQRRMLQSSDFPSNVDMSLHVSDQSGIMMIFRNGNLQNVSVSIDQLINYMLENNQFTAPTSASARLLQEAAYEIESQSFTGSQLIQLYKSQIYAAVQPLFKAGVSLTMNDALLYNLVYDQISGKFNYDISSGNTQSRRRLWGFSSIVSSVTHAVTHTVSSAVNAVKSSGEGIVQAGAQTVHQATHGQILKAATTVAEDVAPAVLPAEVAIPLVIAGKACFNNPPAIHCTTQGAVNAAKTVATNAAESQAASSVFSNFFGDGGFGF